MKSKVISISAISAGLTAISLTVGAYIEFADLFSLVVASIFVILPLYYNSYKGSLLCFLVGGIIAFLFSGFNFLSLVFPCYFLFFGIYPIVFCRLRQVNFSKIFRIIIGLVWCVIMFYGAGYYYFTIMGMDVGTYPVWASFIFENLKIFIGVFAVIFYFIYDRYIYVLKRFSDKYLYKILK